MREAAANLEFEEAARLRDELKRLQETELMIGDDPMARQGDIEAGAGRYGAGDARGGGGLRARAADRGWRSRCRGRWGRGPSGRPRWGRGLSLRPAGRSMEGRPGQAPKYRGRKGRGVRLSVGGRHPT